MVRQVKAAYSRLTRQNIGTEVLIDFLVDMYKGSDEDENELRSKLAKKYNNEVADAVCTRIMGSTELSFSDEEMPAPSFEELFRGAAGYAQDHVTKMVDMYYDPETDDPDTVSVQELLGRAKPEEQIKYINYLREHQTKNNIKNIFWEAYDRAQGDGDTFDDGVVSTILELIKAGYLNKEEWEEPTPLY